VNKYYEYILCLVFIILLDVIRHYLIKNVQYDMNSLYFSIKKKT